MDRDLQIRFFSYNLRQIPDAYSKLDTSRLTLVHFCVHALDLLGVWEEEEHPMSNMKAPIIEWIYSMQITSQDTQEESNVGFKGGDYLGDQPNYQHGHTAMTYTALCTLRALGDDLSRVDKEGIIRGLKHLQLENGSFQCVSIGSEHDMRFLYTVCCISYLLDDWSGVDKEKAVEYIRSCRSFDGAVALLPGQEGHGGSTFTGIASLMLMNKLEEVIDDEWRRELIQWCVQRQVGGMQGRPNKAEDTCYSYWIGGTLRLLGEDFLLDHDQLRAYVYKCQTKMGGFSKVLGVYPDLLHSFYSMAYLSLSQGYCNDGSVPLKELSATLGICKERIPESLLP
jgi:geranylgeranyl transferase type-1 subunit beta